MEQHCSNSDSTWLVRALNFFFSHIEEIYLSNYARVQASHAEVVLPLGYMSLPPNRFELLLVRLLVEKKSGGGGRGGRAGVEGEGGGSGRVGN